MSRVVMVPTWRSASSVSAVSIRCSRNAVAGSSPTRLRTARARLGDIAPNRSRHRQQGEQQCVRREYETTAPLRQQVDTWGGHIFQCQAAVERQPAIEPTDEL